MGLELASHSELYRCSLRRLRRYISMFSLDQTDPAENSVFRGGTASTRRLSFPACVPECVRPFGFTARHSFPTTTNFWSRNRLVRPTPSFIHHQARARDISIIKQFILALRNRYDISSRAPAACFHQLRAPNSAGRP